MLKTVLLLTVSLCALPSAASAQVRLGVSFGERGHVRATFGHRGVQTVGSYSHAGHRHAQTGPRLRVPHYRQGRFGRPVRVTGGVCTVQPVYRTVVERVWVPGYWEDVQVPARYEYRYDSCGRQVRVLVQPGYCKRVWHDGYYRHVERRVLVDG